MSRIIMFLAIFVLVCTGSSAAFRGNKVSKRDTWPLSEDPAKCSQSTKQKAMYGIMTFQPAPSVKAFWGMEVIIRWDDFRFNPNTNQGRKGGVYTAYTLGVKNGPGGYLGPQISRNGGQFLFSIWDGDRFKKVNGKKVPKKSSQLSWPVDMKNCKRNCQDCGMSHLEETKKSGISTGTKCSLKYPDMKVGDEFKITLKRIRKQKRIHTSKLGGMPLGHINELDEKDRYVTGGLWRMWIEDLKRKVKLQVGTILFEGDGSGMHRLGMFDEMIGCNKCNAIHHKDTRYNMTLDAGSKHPRVPIRMQGTTRADESTCKSYKITGQKKYFNKVTKSNEMHSISFEGGPLLEDPFQTEVNKKLIW